MYHKSINPTTGAIQTSTVYYGSDPEYEQKKQIRENIKDIDNIGNETNKLKHEIKEYKITIETQNTKIKDLTYKLEEQNDLYRNSEYRSFFIYFLYLTIPTLVFFINDYKVISNIVPYIIAMIYAIMSNIVDYNKKINEKFRSDNTFLHFILWLNRQPNKFK
jgi:hypothetical protein